jgi:hypothetical protein
MAKGAARQGEGERMAMVFLFGEISNRGAAQSVAVFVVG